ncbi:hypothetical protein [Nocardia sp. X0981]
MSPREPLRTVFFAVSAAVALTAGPALLTAPAVHAAPPAEYPLSGEEDDEGDGGDGGGRSQDSEHTLENGLAEHGERAERAGGGIVTEVIDLSADILKCGLSIATEEIDCPLGD